MHMHLNQLKSSVSKVWWLSKAQSSAEMPQIMSPIMDLMEIEYTNKCMLFKIVAFNYSDNG